MKENYNNKRSKRVRKKLKSVSTGRYRLSVYRSTKNISAQIIDDINNKTLVSASSASKKIEKVKKKEQSSLIAALLAKKALEKRSD